MVSIKDSCKSAIQRLTAAAKMCDEYIQNLVPKKHGIQAAQDAVAVCKKVIEDCRTHVKSCKNNECVTACQMTIRSCEKAVEKNTACIDAFTGSTPDSDCKTVCKDCADASRACIKACQDAMQKVCA
jgi:hypothetical protein